MTDMEAMRRKLAADERHLDSLDEHSLNGSLTWSAIHAIAFDVLMRFVACHEWKYRDLLLEAERNAKRFVEIMKVKGCLP